MAQPSILYVGVGTHSWRWIQSIGICILIICSTHAEANSIKQTIDHLAETLWQQQFQALERGSKISIWPIESHRLEPANICRGLLVSALRSQTADVLFDIRDAEQLAQRFSPYPFEVAALDRISRHLACEMLLTGKLRVGRDRSFLQVTVWDMKQAAAIDLIEVSFETPVAWWEPDSVPDPKYAQMWRSRVFVGQHFLAMAVGDFDGDASNEIALATNTDISFRYWSGLDLQYHVDQPGISYWKEPNKLLLNERSLRTLLVQPERERDRLFISVPSDKIATAAVLEFKQEGMGVAVSGENLWRTRFLPHLGIFSAGQTILVGPEGPKVQPMPENYRALCVANVDDSPEEESILINRDGNLCVYRQQDDRFEKWWQSPPVFGSTISVGDLDGNHLAEIVCSGKDSEFTDDLSILEWDGVTYSMKATWTMDGQIQDIEIADINNDDVDELIVLLNRPLGSIVYLYHAK